jgi:calcineurin-like phosphoesterase family protein
MTEHLGIWIAQNMESVQFSEKEMEMEKVWFISDTHFGHKNIQKFCPNTRKGADIAEHDRILIANWQSQVAQHDRVYCLGDMFFCDSRRAMSIMDQLPGQIHLIYGNHDKVIKSNKDLRDKFTSINDYKEVDLEGIKVCLFHFPIYEWYAIGRGSFHFYGHVHGSVQVPGRAWDVGVDTRPDGDMKLWSWEELKRMMLAREIRHHHENKVM